MHPHELAGKPAPKTSLVNVPRLMTAYYVDKPDVSDVAQKVSFGTSGHRGSSLKSSFNEDHILATSQAICEHRQERGITGPLFLGMDTHALSEAAFATALEVLAAHAVRTVVQRGLRYTPTPAISHAIVSYNKARKDDFADGIVITPSHNPPEDGGFKYNPPHGGPADAETTKLIEARANEILADRLKEVRRIPFKKALKADTTREFDYVSSYVQDLGNILDMDAVSRAKLKIGVDPLGGSSIDFWEPIADTYGVSLEIVNRVVDPTFSFMTLDHDGKIRMDCSSRFAMANLIHLKDKYDIAFGNDTDADRHGIVTKSAGLLNPNHYLAVAVWYLFQNRPGWAKNAAVGKTLVSSSMIDRVAEHLGKKLIEMPVGFKWFVKGLSEGTLGFGGEESAGAAFLGKDGTCWTTDKDGIIMGLLAAEIMARTGKDPAEIYHELVLKLGNPEYARLDFPATPEQKAILRGLSEERVIATELGGDPIISKLTRAPGNHAAIGGLKVVTENAWFAVRPSGTEVIFKIYAESFRGSDHLQRIFKEAEELVNRVLVSSEKTEPTKK